eukprot:TRINITY_DN39552_c0_g1_i1.p1 TRINITY_DN39552_c0_g1~~TRINITY_DN39552_c0_g1_i1.p1  ORF type:complete len:369 (-),score=96.61 TRINITY_DN39552_c0_g1_i1:217-1323(-)
MAPRSRPHGQKQKRRRAAVVPAAFLGVGCLLGGACCLSSLKRAFVGAPSASSASGAQASLGSVKPLGRQMQLTQRQALDAEGLASFAAFSVATGAPIPLALGALLRRAEDVEAAQPAPSPAVASEEPPAVGFQLPEFLQNLLPASEPEPAPATPLPSKEDTAEPRGLMWAFPSFAVFLQGVEETAPLEMPMWGRWLCLATFWPGVVWYLYYKLLVEDDLRRYRGLGIGGSLVIVPFAIGLFAGVFGEFAYGSLEEGMFDNPFAASFYAAFAWIYLNQWFLYNKVNQLFEEEGLPKPLDPLGLFVPGWNFVTGIRQIHFTADYWARQRGEVLRKDDFAELFPFAKKPTLTLQELLTTPSLWFNTKSILG